MSDTKMHNHIKALAAVDIELPLHQRKLKAQLMTLHARQHRSQNWFESTFVIPVKELIHTMQTKSKIVPLTGLAAVAIVAVFAIMGLSGPSKASAAQLQLQETKAAVQQLTPEEAAALKQSVGDGLMQYLDAGLKAKDSRIISADEFKQTTGADPSIKLAKITIASYVAFTNSDGTKMIIAVASNDQPVLAMQDAGHGWTGLSQEQLTK